MSDRREDSTLQVRWIRTSFQHVDVVVGFYNDDVCLDHSLDRQGVPFAHIGENRCGQSAEANDSTERFRRIV